MKKFKNLNEVYRNWIEKLDTKWQELPVGKQHTYTLGFFAVYLLLTAAVILKVWYDAGKHKQISIMHIENPVRIDIQKTATKDTVINHLKENSYERK